MSDGSISSLPVELVARISSHVPQADMPAFLLANKFLNIVGTPLLYSTVELSTFRKLYACIKALDKSPQQVSLGRDLAAFVRTLSISHDCFGPLPPRDRPRPFFSTFAEIAPRLVNLQELRCGDVFCPELNTFWELLVTTPHPQLEIVDIELRPWNNIPGKPVCSLQSPCPAKLQSLRIAPTGVPPSHTVSLLRDVLVFTAGQLRSLVLPESFSLPPGVHFSSLEHLEVDWHALSRVTTPMYRLRSLSIITDEYKTPRKDGSQFNLWC